MDENTVDINTDEILKDLQKLFPAVVCDVLDTLGYTNQALDPAIRPLTPSTTICGKVFTAKAVPIDHVPDELYKLEMKAIDSMQKGDVMVIDGCYDKTCGLWGELLTTACKYKGVNGVVMTASMRDLWNIKKLDFPVFGIGYHPGDSKGRVDIIELQVPLDIGGVKIYQNDFVLGDEDGLVIIPQAVQAETFKLALEKISGENIAREDLAKGVPITEVFHKYGIL